MKNLNINSKIHWLTCIKIFYALFFFTASITSLAKAITNHSTNSDYRIITPTEKKNQQQIEIDVIFWYGCHHCYSLNNKINKRWLKDNKLPQSVTLKHIPGFLVTKDRNWQSHPWVKHAKMYYTMQTLVDEKRITIPKSYNNSPDIYSPSILKQNIEHNAHNLIFDAIHKDKISLRSDKAISTFFKKKFGVSNNYYKKASNSLPVSKKMMKYSSIMKKNLLTGVPAIIIDRTYIIDQKTAGSLEQILVVADKLINKLNNNKNKNNLSKINPLLLSIPK